jgi:hypothetical protein
VGKLCGPWVSCVVEVSCTLLASCNIAGSCVAAVRRWASYGAVVSGCIRPGVGADVTVAHRRREENVTAWRLKREAHVLGTVEDAENSPQRRRFLPPNQR